MSSHTETPAVAPRTPGGGGLVLPLYAFTLFLSAFLLFSVQPMFTKMVLPLLGGSAAVWNTAVVFFQATLLLGYFYAHLSTRHLGPRAQTLVHAGVLLVGFAALPIGVAAWKPPAEGMQIPWLTGLLAISIGLPFFAVSATAPLLQKWFAHTDHAASGDPYFLYGGSNLGSLAALLSYPVVVEPLLGLHAQGRAWTFGYAALFAAIATCGLFLVRRYRAVPELAPAADSEEAGLIRDVTWRLRLRWLALSVVPSALLLGVTLHIGTEIAAAPFLWVLPLALYLLTFVLVFARRPWFSQKWMLRAQVLFVALIAVFYALPTLYVLLGLHLGAMFFTAMVCHGELARLRPRATHLTEFYLWMSIGGVVGGFLTAIVAPLVFDGVYEYPLALVAGLLLRPTAKSARSPVLRWALDLSIPLVLFLLSRTTFAQRAIDDPSLGLQLWTKGLIVLLLFGLAFRPLRLALGFLVAMFFLSPYVLGKPDYVVARARSFFGIYTVNQLDTPSGRFHFLMNGGVMHGSQNLDRPLGPTSYYTREGPVGQFFHIVKDRPTRVKHIGVVGLGVGMMTCYLQPGQRLTYYEIDPLDEEIASDPELFTYLANARDEVVVKIGDGRQLLEQEPDGSLDVLVLAAFTGDAVPVHLLTREAFRLYERKLTDTGMMLMITANAYLELNPVVANLVHDAGLFARISRGAMPTITAGGQVADWVVVARREADLARFAYTNPPWEDLPPSPDAGLWTDDFSNVIRVLRWKQYVDLRAH